MSSVPFIRVDRGSRVPERTASLTINLVYKDVEKAWMNAISFTSDIDILDEAKGLVWVDVKKLPRRE